MHVPSFDNLTNTNDELKGSSLAETTVKLRSIRGQSSDVRHGQLISVLREGYTITWFDGFLDDTHATTDKCYKL